MKKNSDVIFNIRINNELRNKFKKACFENGETQSEAVKKFIINYVKENKLN